MSKNSIVEYDITELEKNINNLSENMNINELDCFVENNLYIQKARKDVLELLSYTKYKLGNFLLSFHYSLESFNSNKNSTGIIYSILSLLNLKLYSQAYFLFINNKDNIINIINSNKSKLDDVIDILIYFNVDINLIYDLNTLTDKLKDKRKKYLYILVNLIKDRKKQLLIEYRESNKSFNIKEKYKTKMLDIYNILIELKLNQLAYLYKIKLENNEDEEIYKMLPCDNIELYIAKALLDEVSLYNKKNIYTPAKINKYNLEDKDVKIISYQLKSTVSMHIIKVKDEYLIVDCGASIENLKIKKINIEKFLNQNNIPKDKIKSVIISHAHLDHYGSLDILQDYVDKIYMTKETYKSISIIANDLNIKEEKLTLINEDDEFTINSLKIKLFPTNHIKGSVGVYIKYKDISIVYTGDFSFNKQSNTRYIDEKEFYKFKNCKYLIMETTCGYKEVDLPYIYNKKLFVYFINLSIKNNRKVIIPTFSIQKAQEYYDLINKSTINANVIIEYDNNRINNYYKQDNKNNEDKSKKINYKLKFSNYYENDIIIVNSKGLSHSKIESYYDLAIKDKSIVNILKCNTIDKETLDNKLKPYDSININLININLSSHANYEDLLKTVNVIKPKNLIMVHGKGIKLYNEKKLIN